MAARQLMECLIHELEATQEMSNKSESMEIAVLENYHLTIVKSVFNKRNLLRLLSPGL